MTAELFHSCFITKDAATRLFAARIYSKYSNLATERCDMQAKGFNKCTFPCARNTCYPDPEGITGKWQASLNYLLGLAVMFLQRAFDECNCLAQNCSVSRPYTCNIFINRILLSSPSCSP